MTPYHIDHMTIIGSINIQLMRILEREFERNYLWQKGGIFIKQERGRFSFLLMVQGHYVFITLFMVQ